MKILVVDDEPDVSEIIGLTFNLQWQGAEVIAAADGESALEIFQQESPDVVILDVGLPGATGFEICRRLREVSDVPILMLTVHGEELDRLRGLGLGADDYIVKPFSSLELVARTRAVLRRSHALSLASSSHIVVDANLTVDLDNRQAILDGQPVRLTPTECRLLTQLVRNAGHAISQKALLAKVWGWDNQEDILMLKVHIARLRGKLRDDVHNPRYIFTERGLGYRFARISTPTPTSDHSA